VKGYADLAELPEDTRIRIIGETMATNRHQTDFTVGVAIDDEKEKYDRYIKKILTRFPDVVVISKKPLFKGIVLVKLGHKPVPGDPACRGDTSTPAPEGTGLNGSAGPQTSPPTP